jgi:hypothetical protein
MTLRQICRSFLAFFESKLIRYCSVLCALGIFSMNLPATAQSTGPGSAVNLDGVSGYVQLPPDVWFTGNFTVEGWVNVRSYNFWSRLIDFGNGGDNYNVYLALTKNTSGYPTIGVFTNNDSLPIFSASNQLPTNQWVHLAATLNGTNGTIYINGNIAGTGTLNISPNVIRTNNYFGRSNYALDGYANAVFDEFRIWKVARNQFQIQTFMGQTLKGPQTNLVGYWRFDENSGSQATDSSGFGRVGTLTGGVSWTNSTAPISAGFGTALDFNGTNQLVSIPHQNSLNAYPITVMTWFKAPTNSFNNALVNKYVSSSFNGYQIFLNGGNLQAWYMRDPGNNIYNNGVMDAGPVNDGLWHHTAMVVDATGGRLYLDGVLKSSATWSGAAGPTTTPFAVNLGYYQGSGAWKGQLDEVSIWNTALTSAQIRSNAMQGLAGTEPNLVAYYPLDEGNGTFTADVTGHGNNGVLALNQGWVPSLPPVGFTARAISASNITPGGALLNGAVNPIGLDTIAWFEYGSTTNYGLTTAVTNLTDGSIVERAVALPVSLSLVANTNYHFRLVASNSVGITMSTDQTFQLVVRNISVTSLADSGAGSLRQALATAQDNDIITLTNGMIVLTGGELMISNSVSIVGLGPSTTAISGNNASRVFNVASSNVTVAFSSLTIRDGRSTPSANGGGIYNLGKLTMDHCAITNNLSGPGAAGANGSGVSDDSTPGNPGGGGGGLCNIGTLSISKCTFENNHAGSGGRGGNGIFGLFNGSYGKPGGNGGNGGAILNLGIASVAQCTISSNQAGAGGAGGDQLAGPGGGGDGGAGGRGGGIFNDGSLTVVASTTAANAGGVGGNGGNGGASAFNGAAGLIGLGGGIYSVGGTNSILRNTIIAGNSAQNYADLAGVFISAGHNFVGQTNGATGITNGFNNDLAGSSAAPLDPKLTPLGNYGGVTRTFELLNGSAVKDAGDDTLLNPPYSLATDQRDFARNAGPHVDIGAVESVLVWPAPTAATLQITPAQDPVFGNWSATLQGDVNPGGFQTTVYFQFGITTGYGGVASAGTLPFLNTNQNLMSATITNLLDSRTYHYRVVATNSSGFFFGADKFFKTLAAPFIPGDINGDGIVDSDEFAAVIANLHTNGIILTADLNLVLSNYFANSAPLYMAGVAGLGSPSVTFALTNSVGDLFNVEYSTNLMNWQLLGPATPRYRFTDTNAPGSSQRYYRLRLP